MGIATDEACPSCQSVGKDKTGNHLMVFENGTKYCNRCKYHVAKDGAVTNSGYLEGGSAPSPPPKQEGTNMYIPRRNAKQINFDEYEGGDIPDRKLLKKFVDMYGVKLAYNEETREITEHYYPVRNTDGKIIAYKIRKLPKDFIFSTSVSKTPKQFFGQQKTGEGGRLLIIVEGELDAIAAKQMLAMEGKDYSVVSLPTGAGGAEGVFRTNIGYLESFNDIILAFDNDEAGQAAVDKVVTLVSPGKIKIAKLPKKDPCDMLVANGSKQFLKAIWQSNKYTPAGIVNGADTWDRIINREEVPCIAYPETYAELQRMTHGIRLGELDVWTAGTGVSKTTFMNELTVHLLDTTDGNIGIVKLEDALEDSVEVLMSIRLEAPIKFKEVRQQFSEEELQQAWDNTSGTGRVYYYDHWGGESEDGELLRKIKELIVASECKYIIIDHLHMAISETATEGDERKRIDVFMSKLKRLTQEHHVWIGLVSHLRKAVGGGSFEEGAVPSLDDLRGSGSIKQLANSVIAVSRDQKADMKWERRVAHTHVLKCRFTGETGEADSLYFHHDKHVYVSRDEMPHDLPIGQVENQGY